MNSVLIQDVWFDDAATSAMGQAFDQARKSLRNFGSASTVREIIAKRIIAAAKNDERDPARLHEQALIPFGIEDLSMQVISVDRAPVPSAYKEAQGWKSAGWVWGFCAAGAAHYRRRERLLAAIKLPAGPDRSQPVDSPAWIVKTSHRLCP